MSKAVFFLLLVLGLSVTPATGQAGFFIAPGKSQMDIPFEYVNNFIIITVLFNGQVPLRFILDTGAETTVLTKKGMIDRINNIAYDKRLIPVIGSDLTTELVARLARGVQFEIPDKVSAPREDMYVLQENYTSFEEYSGVSIDGLLSANAFSRYIIKINYDRKVMTLYERESFKLREDGFVAIPVEIFRNKIYLNTQMRILPDSVAQVKLLLDTGAGLTLLLFSDTHPLVHPPANAVSTNIGMGLGGYLEGYTGRVRQLDLGDFSQDNIVTYFQTLDSTYKREYLNNRNGLIGNTLLSRFQVIIDYQNSKIWLKPGRHFRREYVFDRSGLSLIATGSSFNKFTVQGVLPNSPAAEADIRRGDEIVRVGWMPASFLSLVDIQETLQKKPGKHIKLVIKRDGKRLKKTVVLRDLI